jgi:hypothetical protein
MELKQPLRRNPARIVLHLPNNRPLEQSVSNVEVLTRNPQSVKWDFDTVIEKYRHLKSR